MAAGDVRYNLYANLRNARDVTNFNLFRGTTDWSALYQLDYFETGYPYLVMVSYPEYIRKLASLDDDLAKLKELAAKIA